ncbi:hypothetical protein NUU27_24700, partial [Nitratireductor sp. ZSWI3]|nr:hypothetical protein [Nitratireductor sp. ZSWI3]
FLAGWPVGPALSWLERIYGIGPKTSTATLNLSTLKKRVLVVDTAHWRAARCLGLVPDGTSLERSVRLLNRQAPDGWGAMEMEEHHILMQRLGKDVCSRGGGGCPFHPVCDRKAMPGAPHRRQKRLEDWLQAQHHRQASFPERRKANPNSLLREKPEPFDPNAMGALPAGSPIAFCSQAGPPGVRMNAEDKKIERSLCVQMDAGRSSVSTSPL